MLDLEKIKKLNKNIGFFRFKKFDNNSYLITNDIAKYSFLNKDEFAKFIAGEIKAWQKFNEFMNYCVSLINE